MIRLDDLHLSYPGPQGPETALEAAGLRDARREIGMIFQHFNLLSSRTVFEASLREVDAGLVEATQAMGATPSQVVFKVLLPEAVPGIAAGLTITLVSPTGCSAMAGAIGGGGLGDLDANSDQHEPYLDAQVKDRGDRLVPVGHTVGF